MKKIVFYFNMLLIAALMTTGCDNSNDDKIKANYIEYNGKTYSIKEAGQLFYGHYYSVNSNNITLVLATDEHYVVFEMFVPNSGTKLVTGVYQPDNTYQPFTVASGAVLKSDNTVLYSMKTAVITVKLEGSIYTIDVDGTLENNTNVKGSFTGQIEWFDNSDDAEGSSGSMTITGGGSPQIIDFEDAQQLRSFSGTSNSFMVYFSPTFIVTFRTSNLTATSLPAGSYPISTDTPIPAGTSRVSMNIPGVSGTVNSSGGSFNVQKSGSSYTVTFNFTTNTTPVRTVTGTYTGVIPVYE